MTKPERVTPPPGRAGDGGGATRPFGILRILILAFARKIKILMSNGPWFHLSSARFQKAW